MFQVLIMPTWTWIMYRAPFGMQLKGALYNYQTNPKPARRRVGFALS
jgi:hypothetical protein